MMISPDCFAMDNMGKSYDELIIIRNELMDEIRAFEEGRVPEEEYRIDPSPEVRYWCNLKYMVEICKLVDEAYNAEDDEIEGDEEDKEDEENEEEKVRSRMTQFHFLRFVDYDDGKIAMLESIEEAYPLNVYIDNYTDVADIDECDVEIEVYGIGSDITVYQDEEELLADSESNMAPISLIPMGTFAIESNMDTFEPSPHILFSGKVLNSEINPDAQDGEPNYCLVVETLGMIITLYLRSDGKIIPGNYVHGVAWLFGDLVRDGRE